MPNTAAKHTPGPWTVSEHADDASLPGDPHAYGVLAFAGDPIQSEIIKTRTLREADARLIAAAPDLLAALKYAERMMVPTGFGADALSIVRAAIAKAEGRTA